MRRIIPLPSQIGFNGKPDFEEQSSQARDGPPDRPRRFTHTKKCRATDAQPDRIGAPLARGSAVGRAGPGRGERAEPAARGAANRRARRAVRTQVRAHACRVALPLSVARARREASSKRVLTSPPQKKGIMRKAAAMGDLRPIDCRTRATRRRRRRDGAVIVRRERRRSRARGAALRARGGRVRAAGRLARRRALREHVATLAHPAERAAGASRRRSTPARAPRFEHAVLDAILGHVCADFAARLAELLPRVAAVLALLRQDRRRRTRLRGSRCGARSAATAAHRDVQAVRSCCRSRTRSTSTCACCARCATPSPACSRPTAARRSCTSAPTTAPPAPAPATAATAAAATAAAAPLARRAPATPAARARARAAGAPRGRSRPRTTSTPRSGSSSNYLMEAQTPPRRRAPRDAS